MIKNKCNIFYNCVREKEKQKRGKRREREKDAIFFKPKEKTAERSKYINYTFLRLHVYLLISIKMREKLVRWRFLVRLGHWRVAAMSEIHRFRRKQALGNQAYLVHVSLHIESQRSSYSRWSNGQDKQERKKERDRDRDKGPARFATWPPVVRLRGTVSARKHKASPLSFFHSFPPPLFLPFSTPRSLFLFSLFIPEIDRNLATRRCTPRWICGKERQLHCSAYFIFVHLPI